MINNLSAFKRFSCILLSIGIAVVQLKAAHGQTFDPVRTFPISSQVNKGPESIEAADLDGDGNLDLVTADDGFITVLFGDGNGNFPTLLTLPTRAENNPAVAGVEENEYAAIADVNGDSHPDILVANAPNPNDSNGNSIQIFLNDAQNPGTFLTPALTVVEGIGANPSAIQPGQFDPLVNNRLDIVLTNFINPRVIVYHGDNLGGFTPGFESNLISQSQTESVDVGDYNHDGIDDIAVVDRQRVWVFFGNGTGGFGTSFSVITGPAGSRLEYDVEMHDVDGDGNQDLVIGNGGVFPADLSSTERTVIIFWGDGTTQAPAANTPLDVGAAVSDVEVADMNGDGFLEVIAARPDFFADGSVLIARNMGGNGREFDTGNPVVLDGMVRGMLSLATKDFNSDGRIDVAVAAEGLFVQSQDDIPGEVNVFINSLPDIATPTPTRSSTFIPTSTPTGTATASPTITETPLATSTPTISPTQGPTKPSDINEDGAVNSEDLMILLEQQGNTVE